MGRSAGASFEVVTCNLVEESNGVPFEFFNGVNEKRCKCAMMYNTHYYISNTVIRSVSISVLKSSLFFDF